jgi:hypothetical protein
MVIWWDRAHRIKWSINTPPSQIFLFSFSLSLSLSPLSLSLKVPSPEKNSTVADGGATFFSGQPSSGNGPKHKNFNTNPILFYSLFPNPKPKYPKSLPIDRIGEKKDGGSSFPLVFVSVSISLPLLWASPLLSFLFHFVIFLLSVCCPCVCWCVCVTVFELVLWS